MTSRRLNKIIFTKGQLILQKGLARHLDLMISRIKISFSFILTCVYIVILFTTVGSRAFLDTHSFQIA